ncbi:MAG: hypothetical protein A3F90_00015 [Deltaproteobacteria bacterium RIFCSPLOWO2_12_FULL_60_19]|nr:MAG: hypothetical protein A3F90_00015 [Deltaproteobacteria bacterium RIFCSPLOWO2_12_FULL_60_19]
MRDPVVALLVWIWLLISVSPVRADKQEELWENQAFAKKAQAIKEGNWDKVNTRDIAIVTLFELGRKADAIEDYLKSRVDRVTASTLNMLWIGGGILGAYAVLQLFINVLLVLKLRRLEKAAYLQSRQAIDKDVGL